jgi:ketosteroid isomerase-like protein
MSNTDAMVGLADRFFAAIEATDTTTLGQIYASNAVVWHNYDDIEQPRDENIAMLARFPTMFKTFRYADVRRCYFDGGFVQQHVCRGIMADGRPFEVPNCMVVLVDGGRIVRIDDYFDSAQDARPVSDR